MCARHAFVYALLTGDHGGEHVRSVAQVLAGGVGHVLDDALDHVVHERRRDDVALRDEHAVRRHQAAARRRVEVKAYRVARNRLCAPVYVRARANQCLKMRKI